MNEWKVLSFLKTSLDNDEFSVWPLPPVVMINFNVFQNNFRLPPKKLVEIMTLPIHVLPAIMK